MKKFIYLVLLFFVGFLVSCTNENNSSSQNDSAVETIEIEGVKLPQKLVSGDTELVLNGAGIRSKFFIKIYVGGLYLPKKTVEPRAREAGQKPCLERERHGRMAMVEPTPEHRNCACSAKRQPQSQRNQAQVSHQ